tara:strand:- start:4005 stop:5573 length:1569 start_codon:yes stop_codon:yes gene_type:complete
MKFKELIGEDKVYFIEVYFNKELSWDNRMQLLMALTKKSERTVRYWAVRLGLTQKTLVDSPDLELAKTKIHDKSKKRFIITWAQNATPVHKKLLKNIEAYSEFLDAEIIVIAGRYNNPTSLRVNKTNDYWDKSLTKYLSAKRHDIHKYMTIMSDVRTQPTAVNPMSGMEGMSRDNSCIFGHPKVHMKMIPVLNNYRPKMMMTTGSITKMNYTDSKAGKKSEFHHQYGFVVVEIENEATFHSRQVTTEKNGSFYDLFFHVKDGSVVRNDKIPGIVIGDLHYGEHDEKVLSKTFELLSRLKPKTVILHDVFDGKSISHHTQDNPFIQYGMEVNGNNSLKDEIGVMLDGLDNFKDFENVIIVRSNHDVHLDKYLLSDWRKLPTTKNSIEYMEYSKILLEQHANGDVKGIIPELINRKFPKFKTLTYNDTYKVCGYEVAMHGDLGSNGSRGSATQFRKLNTKMITAHTHSPSRFDNVICTGTTTKLRLSYNKGASGWLQSHVVIFPNGKCQHINFIGDNKEYTTID